MQGAKADGFVTDIMTISGGSSSIKNQYIEQGWTVAGGDLNSGAGGDYVYLLYKTTNDNGSSGTPVTDVYLMIKDTYSHSQTLKQGGRTYQLGLVATTLIKELVATISTSTTPRNPLPTVAR